MGTTINGVYNGGKEGRRRRALQRLEAQVKVMQAEFDNNLTKAKDPRGYTWATAERIARVTKEIETLKSRL